MHFNCSNFAACTHPTNANTYYSQIMTDGWLRHTDISISGQGLHYVWLFGDGEMVDTTDKVINHTYLSRGQYNVTLSVTTAHHTFINYTVVTIQVGVIQFQCVFIVCFISKLVVVYGQGMSTIFRMPSFRYYI